MSEVRRVWTQVEDVLHEFGPRDAPPQRRAVIAAVVTNPYAGRFEPNIQPMMEELKPLGVRHSPSITASSSLIPVPMTLSIFDMIARRP